METSEKHISGGFEETINKRLSEKNSTSQKKDKRKEQELFAFWKYDQLPYLLGGEVSEMRGDGAVYIDSYTGWFQPRILMPKQKGAQLYENLQKIRKEYREAKKRLRKEYIEKTIDIIGRYDHETPDHIEKSLERLEDKLGG